MAASTDFDYANILSLEAAKIRRRGRLNFLGSKDLVIEYPKIAPAQKEEAVEWLDDNRLTLVNPELNYKTLDGTWKCVDITYSDDSGVLRQTFKIDSKLGGYPDTAGNGASISLTSEAERTYLWRVVDPDSVNIPASTTAGITYDKSAVDNGDGTYDVTITKRTAQNTSVLSKITRREELFESETDYHWNAASEDTIDIPASPSVGESYQKSVGQNSDGTFNLVREKTTAQNQNVSDNIVAKNAAVETEADFEWNAPSEDTIAIPGTVAAGDSYRKSLSKNRDGTFDIVVEKTTASELEGDSVRATPLYTEYKTTTINDDEVDFETYLTAWMATISEYDLDEISPDAGFDDSGAWTTLTNATVNNSSDSALTLSPTVGSASLASAGNILTQGNNYHIVYTITSNASALQLTFSDIEIPSTVGTHDIVINTDEQFHLEVAAGTADDVVLSSFSCVNYYGVASSDYSATDPTDAYELFMTSTPLGVECIVDNYPLENGKFRTEGVIRHHKKNNYFSVPNLITSTSVALKNYTRAEMTSLMDDLDTAGATVARFQYSINNLGLIDSTFRLSLP